jgi:hypothetical protein
MVTVGGGEGALPVGLPLRFYPLPWARRRQREWCWCQSPTVPAFHVRAGLLGFSTSDMHIFSPVLLALGKGRSSSSGRVEPNPTKSVARKGRSFVRKHISTECAVHMQNQANHSFASGLSLITP